MAGTLIFRSRSRTIETIIHISFWLCFLLIPFVFSPTPYNDFAFILKLLINTTFLAIFFYANSLILIPRLLGTKKIFPYILTIILITAFFVGIQLIIEYIMNPEMYERHWFVDKKITDGIFASLIVFTISSGMKITNEWFVNERRRKEIEREKIASELALLKSQVNPHFLFNTLNNIRSLVRKNSVYTETAILKLSQLMRYMIHEANEEKVALVKEIDYIKDYIDLQKLRLSEKVVIEFELIGNPEGKMIEPMLLIPFVENAFKHGLSYRDDSYVYIKLEVNDGKLSFTTRNRFNPSKEVNVTECSGFGLSNIRRRLTFLYPDDHQLQVEQDDNEFRVFLTLKWK